jgi:DNA-binding transcriptional MerR regulator
MPGNQTDGALRIGELATRAGTSADTVRYYEKLGLLGPPSRSEGGYRLYGAAELGRLQFIRRAKLLGLSLEEIRGLLGLAEEGDCHPLRGKVAALLRRKIEECEAKLTELTAFKANLQERYRLALQNRDEPACDCATFPASCACLPVQIQEVTPPEIGASDGHHSRRQDVRRMDAPTIINAGKSRPPDSDELRVLNTGCGCGCDGACGCGSARAEPRAQQACGCGCTSQER